RRVTLPRTVPKSLRATDTPSARHASCARKISSFVCSRMPLDGVNHRCGRHSSPQGEMTVRMFDIRKYEMLVRVNAFGVAPPDASPEDSGGRNLFAALDGVVGRLETHVVAEAASKNSARQGASAKDAAGTRLRDLMGPLNRTAKLVTAGTPGLAEKF